MPTIRLFRSKNPELCKIPPLFGDTKRGGGGHIFFVDLMFVCVVSLSQAENCDEKGRGDWLKRRHEGTGSTNCIREPRTPTNA